jgi:integrase
MSARDKRRLEQTSTPGVYKRVNANGEPTGSYVAVFRAGGKQRRRSAKTLAEARAIKREAETDHKRGEFQPPNQTKFTDYLADWIKTYHGTRGREFRDGTRVEYDRLLRKYALAYFGAPGREKLRLTDITPRHVHDFVEWLADDEKQGQRLSDQSIANAATPVRAALATARRKGELRTNPASDLALPRRGRVHDAGDHDDDEHNVKALSREQLRLLLEMTPPRYRLLIELVASTGLRISEAIGLQRKHVHLDGSRPHVKVRRAVVRRRVEGPKTKYGRREVPLPHSLVLVLRAHLAALPDDAEAVVFPNAVGTPLDPHTVRRDFLGAAMEEIGASGLSFHALRHTYASLQLARGVNVVALSRVLGHHSAAFTLATYTHLLPGDEAPPLDLSTDVEPIVPEVVSADLVG